MLSTGPGGVTTTDSPDISRIRLRAGSAKRQGSARARTTDHQTGGIAVSRQSNDVSWLACVSFVHIYARVETFLADPLAVSRSCDAPVTRRLPCPAPGCSLDLDVGLFLKNRKRGSTVAFTHKNSKGD